MSELTSRDLRLWNDLICACLREPQTNISEIRKAAALAAGAKKNFKFGKAAALPDSEWRWEGGKLVFNPDSVFLKLTAVGRNLLVGDRISRQLLVDYAHAARRILKARPDGAPPAAPGAAKAVPVEPLSDLDTLAERRRDIYG
ncbi:hypothetical protein [Asticcacaulis taihuensis]|uniref:hypothetical protein n=1 Tax=Asticcacaulis taihuensis TaxID=260084 RepID=UPI0026EC701D|nr:hypothetical protein [Asticcacaulis taihuensis]